MPRSLPEAHTSVVETRLISLDYGSHLNRTEVSYGGLRQSLPVASGIVIHPQNPDGYVCQPDKGYVAYADSTDNPHGNNGIIYLGNGLPPAFVSRRSPMVHPR